LEAILDRSSALKKSVEKYCDTEFFASPSFEALDHSKASARSGIFDIVKKWV